MIKNKFLHEGERLNFFNYHVFVFVYIAYDNFECDNIHGIPPPKTHISLFSFSSKETEVIIVCFIQSILVIG